MRAQRLVLQPRLILQQLALSVDCRVHVDGPRRGHSSHQAPRTRIDGLTLTSLGRAGLEASTGVSASLAGFVGPGVDAKNERSRLLSEAIEIESCRLAPLLLWSTAPRQGPAGHCREAEAEQQHRERAQLSIWRWGVRKVKERRRLRALLPPSVLSASTLSGTHNVRGLLPGIRKDVCLSKCSSAARRPQATTLLASHLR